MSFAERIDTVLGLIRVQQSSDCFNTLPEGQAQVSINKFHEFLSWEVEWIKTACADKKQASRQTFDGAVSEITRHCITLLTNQLEHKGKFHEGDVSKMENRLREYNNLSSATTPAVPHEDEAPELEGEPIHRPDKDGDWLKVENKKGKRKAQRAGTVTKIVLSTAVEEMSVADDQESVADSVNDKRDVGVGEWFYPPHSKPCNLIYVPGIVELQVAGKRIPPHFWSKEKSSPEAKWVEIESAKWYDASTLSKEHVTAMFRQGLISSKRYPSLLSVTGENLVPSPVFEGDEPPKEHTEFSQVAMVAHYHALTENLLTKNHRDSKVPFINTWYLRLSTVPVELNPIGPAKKLYLTLKSLFKQPVAKQNINKVYHSFLMGNLACWKKNETRTDFVARTANSLKYWWASQAETYLREWMKTPDAMHEKRPSNFGRFLQASKTFGRPMAAKLMGAAVVGTSYAAAASMSAAEKAEEKLKSVGDWDNMTWWQRAVYVGLRGKAHLKKTGNAISETGTSTISKASSTIVNCFYDKIEIPADDSVEGDKPSVVYKRKSISAIILAPFKFAKSKLEGLLVWSGKWFNHSLSD